MTNSRAKGARGERELAKELGRILGTDDIRRGQQFSGVEGKDVLGVPDLHIECKRVQKLNLLRAMEQAIGDAAEDECPIVCHRVDRGEWMLTVRLNDLEDLWQILGRYFK